MNAPHERVLQVGHGLFDPLSGELSLDDGAVKLRPRTAAVLAHLLRNSDRVVGKDELMQAVWPDVVVTEDSLVQCIKEIRQALGHAGRGWIRTVPRQGYAFVAKPQAPPAVVAEPPAGRAWRRPPALVLGACVAIGSLAVGLSGWRGNEAGALPPVRSVMVTPVVNLSGDPAREDAADDLTEVLINALGRMRTTVIAPGTAFTLKGKPVDARRIGAEFKVRYVLEGALKMQDARPVLAMRLLDTANAAQLWQQSFALGPGGMPELREDVLGGVAASLGLQLIHAEARRSGEPHAMQAAELLSRAGAIMRWASPRADQVLQVRALLRDAVRLDPTLATAWAMLAGNYLQEVRFSPTRQEDLRHAAQAVERALALATDSDGVRLVEAHLAYEQGRMEEALASFRRVIEINPNNAAALGFQAAALVMLGRPQEAFAPIEQAMRLSPRDPRLVSWLMYGGVAHLHLGQHGAAVEWLAQAVDKSPESVFGRLFLAGALGAAGRVDEASAQVQRLQSLRPGITITRFRAAEPSSTPAFRQQREQLYAGLRRAGLPE